MDPNKLAHRIRQTGLGMIAGICSGGVMYGALGDDLIMSGLALMILLYILRISKDQAPNNAAPAWCWLLGHTPIDETYPHPGEIRTCRRCGTRIEPTWVDSIAYEWVAEETPG